MSFLYYFPGVEAAELSADKILEYDPPDRGRPYERSYRISTSLAELVEYSKIFSDQVFSSQVNNAGPDGGRGVIFCPRPETGDEPETRYDPARQIWKLWNGGGKPFFVGIDRQFPPGPRTLERGRHFPGEPLILADGHEWIAPIIRRGGHKTTIPCSWQLDDAGEQLVEAPDDRFVWAWELAGECFDDAIGPLFSRKAKPLGNGNNVDRFAACASLLSLNYRVSAIECSLFMVPTSEGEFVDCPLITSETAEHIIRAAVDAGLIAEMLDNPEVRDYFRAAGRSDPLEKKNADSGDRSSSATGPPDA